MEPMEDGEDFYTSMRQRIETEIEQRLTTGDPLSRKVNATAMLFGLRHYRREGKEPEPESLVAVLWRRLARWYEDNGR